MARKKKSKGVESEMKALKKVSFTLLAPGAQHVSLAGEFNGWDNHSHLLKKDSNGKWEVHLDLTPGRYEYRFLVDRQWQNDPNCISFVPNHFGSENCVLILE